MKFKKGNLEKQITKVPKEVFWCKKCVMSNQRPRIILMKIRFVVDVKIMILKIP